MQQQLLWQQQQQHAQLFGQHSLSTRHDGEANCRTAEWCKHSSKPAVEGAAADGTQSQHGKMIAK
jgi:hypothetical protein